MRQDPRCEPALARGLSCFCRTPMPPHRLRQLSPHRAAPVMRAYRPTTPDLLMKERLTQAVGEVRQTSFRLSSQLTLMPPRVTPSSDTSHIQKPPAGYSSQRSVWARSRPAVRGGLGARTATEQTGVR